MCSTIPLPQSFMCVCVRVYGQPLYQNILCLKETSLIQNINKILIFISLITHLTFLPYIKKGFHTIVMHTTVRNTLLFL